MSSTSPGMSIHGSVLTSCRISDSGNSGARSAGPTGSCVPGCNGGSGCMPACTIDGMMLNQAVGIWSCDRSKRVCSATRPSLRLGSRAYRGASEGATGSAGRQRRDLEPALDFARHEQLQRIAGRSLDRLAGLEVEDAVAPVAGEPGGPIVERALGQRARLAGAGLAECEQSPLVVG